MEYYVYNPASPESKLKLQHTWKIVRAESLDELEEKVNKEINSGYNFPKTQIHTVFNNGNTVFVITLEKTEMVKVQS